MFRSKIDRMSVVSRQPWQLHGELYHTTLPFVHNNRRRTIQHLLGPKGPRSITWLRLARGRQRTGITALQCPVAHISHLTYATHDILIFGATAKRQWFFSLLWGRDVIDRKWLLFCFLPADHISQLVNEERSESPPIWALFMSASNYFRSLWEHATMLLM